VFQKIGIGIVSLAFAFSLWGAQEPEKASKRHFIFLDQEFIFTLELVQAGVPILNFVNLGSGNYHLQAPEVRIISGIKLYRPRLFDVETSDRRDPLRVGSLKIHPHSSFGVTLMGDLSQVTEIDRVTIQIGTDQFNLQSISAKAFDALSQKIGNINLLSPDIREDFRVLELQPLGQRKRLSR
jgi:hypothetical protein